MKHPKTPDSALRRNFLRQLQKLRPAIKGSLAEIRKPCIRPNCPACARGDKHPAFILSFTDKSRRRCMYVPAELVPQLRQALTNGKALEVFGSKRSPGTLVVDRYNGYNRAPCLIQYCYPHLLREVQDLGKEFPEVGEVLQFVARFAPLLADAIQLRARGLTAAAFGQRALELKMDIKTLVHSPAQHPGIEKIQNIFREKAARLYHWSRKAAIPADNNRAERELRPLVIARKISFGSQSEQGARTREILMSVLLTLDKRTGDAFGVFKRTLDALAEGEKRDPCNLLFDSS